MITKGVQYVNGSTRKNYVRHMNTVHKNGKKEPGVMIQSRLRANALLAEIDAGNQDSMRCTICERDYSDRYIYRKHVYRYHKDGKKEPAALPRGTKANIDTSVIPIWNDPNYYCRSCRRIYSIKQKYHTHITNVHTEILQEAIQLSTSISM